MLSRLVLLIYMHATTTLTGRVFGDSTSKRSRLNREANTTITSGDFGMVSPLFNNYQQQSIICRIVQIYADYEGGARDETLCTLLVDGGESAYNYNIDLPKRLISQHWEDFKNGDLFIAIEGATLSASSTIELSDSSTITVLQDYLSQQAGLRSSTDFTNAQRNRSLAVIAISLSDSPLMFSKENISYTLWQQPVTFQTQFAACSLGQLNWLPAGVYEVILDESIADIVNVATVRNLAVENLIEQGLISPSGLAQELADNVMFLIPPLSMELGFIANAGSPHWQSTYSNKWSLDLNTVMHELSHNLGRGHAWRQYPNHGEETSVMSPFKIGEYSFQTPQICFNAMENSQFRWYDSRKVAVNLIEGSKETMQLVSTVDWDTTSPSIPIIITIDNSLFLQFNRKASFTIGLQQQSANQVLVTRTFPGYNERVASLKVGQKVIVDFLYEYATLAIKVDDFDSVSSIATVSFETITMPSGAPSPMPSSEPSASQSPSTSPQPSNMPSFTKIPIESPTLTPTGEPSQLPSYIKACRDTPLAGIRFMSQNGKQVFSKCNQIPENNWEELACPQWNRRLLPPRERIYETCGNQCSEWSGCGRPQTR